MLEWVQEAWKCIRGVEGRVAGKREHHLHVTTIRLSLASQVKSSCGRRGGKKSVGDKKSVGTNAVRQKGNKPSQVCVGCKANMASDCNV